MDGIDIFVAEQAIREPMIELVTTPERARARTEDVDHENARNGAVDLERGQEAEHVVAAVR